MVFVCLHIRAVLHGPRLEVLLNIMEAGERWSKQSSLPLDRQNTMNKVYASKACLIGLSLSAGFYLLSFHSFLKQYHCLGTKSLPHEPDRLYSIEVLQLYPEGSLENSLCDNYVNFVFFLLFSVSVNDTCNFFLGGRGKSHSFCFAFRLIVCLFP